jgi:hypothetical protein
MCQKCQSDFPEKEIQLSHDIPKYISGTDKNGRHYLCKKCHDVYEKTIFNIMTKWLPAETKDIMKWKAKMFSKRWFNASI